MEDSLLLPPSPRPGGLFSVAQILSAMPPRSNWSQVGVCVSAPSSLPSPRRWEKGNHSRWCLSTCNQSSTGGYKRIFVSLISSITLNKMISPVVRKNRTVQLQLLQHYWLGHRLGLLWYWMVYLGNEQRSFCHFWDCTQVLHERYRDISHDLTNIKSKFHGI